MSRSPAVEVGAVLAVEGSQPDERVDDLVGPERVVDRRGSERPVVEQDLLLQPTQLRGRVEAELFPDQGPMPFDGPERIGLSARSVQGQDLQVHQPLSQRELDGEPLQLANDVAMAQGVQVGVDAIFDRLEPELLESAGLRLGEVLVGHVFEGRAPPQAEPAGQELGRGGWLVPDQLAALGNQPFEPHRIDVIVVDRQGVAVIAGQQHRALGVRLPLRF